MDDQNKFPFELPTADESPAKNPPMAVPVPPAAPKSVPNFKIVTGQGAIPAGSTDFLSPETVEASPVPKGVQKGTDLVKNIVLVVVALIFVGGVGALSYFVIFPMLFPVKQAPVIKVPPAAEQLAHYSFLLKPVAATADINLNDHQYLTIAAALQNESFNQLSEGQIKEVRISEGGQQLPFSVMLSSVAPSASVFASSDNLEKDFTALLYYDNNGVWPIYITKIKSGIDASVVVSGFRSLESTLETGNFYLASPGSFAQFKDGKVGNFATRYAVGTQAGASFNYGAVGNYFVVSASYNGMKAVPALLGL